MAHPFPVPLRLSAARLLAAAALALLVPGLFLYAGRSAIPVAALLAAGALAAYWPLRRAASRVGPRNLADPPLALLGVVGVVAAVHPVLGLPAAVLLVVAAVLGGSLGALAACDAGLRRTGVRPPVWSLLGALPVLALPFASAAAFPANAGIVPSGLASAACAGAALVALSRAADPVRPGPSPVLPFLPWTDGRGKPWPGWRRLPLAAPLTFLYLGVSWTLFIPFAEPGPGYWYVPEERLGAWTYSIPDLTAAPLAAFRSLLTAPFVNHDSVQLVYVTALFLLFVLPFEARERPARTGLLFLGTTFVGAIVAGVLLHLLYPAVSAHPILADAWERTWSGGSAGAFGLMGALSARARNPWPLLAFFVFWEVNVGWWYLRSWTPAFHLTALATGFLAARFLVAPPTPQPTNADS